MSLRLIRGNLKCPPLSRLVFEKYDKDGSMSIDGNEFAEMCYDMGNYLSPEQLTNALLQIDSNGNGDIDYEEFVVWWKQGEVYFFTDSIQF